MNAEARPPVPTDSRTPKKVESAEAVLIDLLEAEAPILAELQRAKLELVARLHVVMDDHRRAKLVAEVLERVATTAALISRRQEHVCCSLAAMRSQRRLVEGRDHGD